MRALVFFIAVNFFAVIMLCGLMPGASDGSELHDIKVDNERTVSLQVVDVPLNEVLTILAKNVPMEIRGTVASQERITVQFSNLTLEEALSRIMRGYNYVLVRPDESAKALLVVMNKIDRTMQTEPASVTPAHGSPVNIPAAAPAQGGRTRPGIQPAPSRQGQEASSPVVGPAGTGQAGPQTPESQPGLPGSGPAAGPVPPLPGVPMGPGALPPGMAAGQGGSFSAAGVAPPVPFPPPGAMSPPAEGSGTSAPQPAPPAQPQQPAQQSREPARVMTPFGERSAEPPDTGLQAPIQPPQ